ncbi:MAG: dienelactone hydrolase family protein [Hyphomicrobiales bacterium]
MCDLDGCGAHNDLPPIVIRETDRRAFLIGAASLPLAAILFDPELAAASAARTEAVRFPAAGGAAEAGGFLAVPETTPAGALVLIHEWWGLNDQIKAVAQAFADAGYLALAVDLYGGKVAGTADEATALVQGLDPAAATATLAGAIEWLRGHEKGNGKVGTVGWCFGGGWSLNASIAAPVDATVIYYGAVTRKADELARLNGPVLGHFGTLDKRINKEMVSGFEAEMAKAGKADRLTVNWYEADHAFANPTGARYDAEDAKLAWERTLDFLKGTLSV